MAWEMEEIGKLTIAIIVLVILVGGAIYLLGERGSEILSAIKNTLRFGK